MKDLGVRAGIIKRQVAVRVDQSGHHGLARSVDPLQVGPRLGLSVGLRPDGLDLAALHKDRAFKCGLRRPVDNAPVLNDQVGHLSHSYWITRKSLRAFSASLACGLCAARSSGASQPAKFVPKTRRSSPTKPVKSSSAPSLLR